MSDVGAMATEAMGFLVKAVEQIAPENWYRPSNLEGWGIPDLVAHVNGSAAKIVTLVEGGKSGKIPPSRSTRTEPHGSTSWPTGCRTPWRART